MAPNMKTTRARINHESAAALKALLNSTVGTLLSPHAEMRHGSSIIAVKHVSIPLAEDRFVIIECEWDETAAGYDYYRLSARLTDRPKDIEHRRRAWKHFSLSLGASQTVATVEVLEEQLLIEEEALRFDAGVRITLQDGMQITIVRQESIAGLLEFAALPEDNAELASDLQTRLLYGRRPAKTA